MAPPQGALLMESDLSDPGGFDDPLSSRDDCLVPFDVGRHGALTPLQLEL